MEEDLPLSTIKGMRGVVDAFYLDRDILYGQPRSITTLFFLRTMYFIVITDSLIVVIDSHRQHSLSLILPYDILVQIGLDFRRRWHFEVITDGIMSLACLAVKDLYRSMSTTVAY